MPNLGIMMPMPPLRLNNLEFSAAVEASERSPLRPDLPKWNLNQHFFG